MFPESSILTKLQLFCCMSFRRATESRAVGVIVAICNVAKWKGRPFEDELSKSVCSTVICPGLIKKKKRLGHQTSVFRRNLHTAKKAKRADACMKRIAIPLENVLCCKLCSLLLFRHLTIEMEIVQVLVQKLKSIMCSLILYKTNIRTLLSMCA